MALTDHKINSVNTTIQDLADRPNAAGLSAQQLKEKFDAFPELLRQKHNALIEELDSGFATEQKVENHIEKMAGIDTAGHVKVDGNTVILNDNNQLKANYEEEIASHAETVATSAVAGHVKIDGSTIVLNANGQLTAVGGGSGGSSEDVEAHALKVATTAAAGHIKIDGTSLVFNDAGQLSAASSAQLAQHINAAASQNAAGHVKIDGSTIILDENGCLKAASAGAPDFATEEEAIAGTVTDKVLSPATGMAAFTANAPKEATVIVAASNSVNKEGADFICPETGAQKVIQQAIDSLPATGGKIFFREGTYSLNAEGAETDDITYICINCQQNGVIFEGSGYGTKFSLAQNSLSNGMDLSLFYINGNNIEFRNMFIAGNKHNNTGGTVNLFFGGYGNTLRINGCNLNGGTYGINTELNTLYVTDSYINVCDTGIYCAGNNVQLYNNHFNNCPLGVEILDGSWINIKGNLIYNSTTTGISCGGSNFVIADNEINSPVCIHCNLGSDGLVYGNLLRRNANGAAFGSSEYPVQLSGCINVNVLLNDCTGGAVEIDSSCSDCLKALPSSDWNIVT